MKLVKWLSLLMVAMVAMFAAGCGGDSKPAGGNDGKIHVTFWHVYSENFGAPVIKEMVEEFNKSQDKIVVKEVYNPDMYPGLMKNLQAEAAAGKAPSIAMIGYNYSKYFAQNFKYVSPTDLQAQDSKDKEYLQKNFLPNVLSLAEVDGKLIGLPYSISAPILYYNPEIFQAAGLDPNTPPKTWADVQEFAKIIKEKTGNYGFYMQEYADNWAIQGVLESNGARILSEDGKQATFASPESKEAYEALYNMIKDGSALHISADEGIAAFSSGKVGILAGSSAKIGTITKAASFEVRGAEYPGFEGKERRLPAGGNFLAVTAQNKDEQMAAWEFIKFIMQPKWLAKWTMNTGYLPPRQEAMDDEALKEQLAKSEPLKVAFTEMPSLAPWVAFPGDVGVRAEKLFADVRDKIFDGKEDIQTALQSAQDELNALLK